MRLHEEDDTQTDAFKWAQYYPILKAKYWCIANGGYNLSVHAQARLKRLGRRKGLPDSMLLARSPCINPLDNYPYSGLAVEFKSKDGFLSAAQSICKADLIDEGWKFVVCKTLDEFIKEVKEYLGARLING